MTDMEKKNKEFISAAAAIYAWMSAADGEITKSEIAGFVEYLNSLDFVDEISDADFEYLYLNLLSAFEIDYDDGLSRAQARIDAYKGSVDECKDLLRVARKALVADSRLNEAEEKALREIAFLLGLVEGETP